MGPCPFCPLTPETRALPLTRAGRVRVLEIRLLVHPEPRLVSLFLLLWAPRAVVLPILYPHPIPAPVLFSVLIPHPASVPILVDPKPVWVSLPALAPRIPWPGPASLLVLGL